ncbi:ATP-binding protein [Gracilibacillus dipsosauri]|uniref:ATP-binding protein n=2 Tax=Gracilibacillus TaxID=74385 RepID=UPI002409FC66
MRIESVHIYGFGKWQNKQFYLNNSSLLEITGENEAGKSTLRQFILYMLFGLPSKKLEKYLPKQGAQIGGRMVISALSSKEVTVERVQGKNKGKAIIYLENGKREEEAWLLQHIRGIDRAQYEAIYSFDSADLRQIHQLNNDSLNDVLLAVGMTGSDRIYYAEKKLEKDRSDLFKPFGKKPAINQVLAELSMLKKKLSVAKEEEATYNDRLTKIRALEEEIVQLEKSIEEKQAHQLQLEKILSYYAQIEEYYLTIQQLDRLTGLTDFPAHGLERYKRLKEELLPYKSENLMLQRNIEEIKHKLDTLSDTVFSEEDIGLLKQAMELSDAIKQWKKQKNEHEQKIKNIEVEVHTKLQSLQITLSVEELEALTLPFYLEELWTDLSKQKDQLELENQYIRNELQALDKIIKELKEKKQSCQSSLVDAAIISKYQQEVEKSKINREQQSQIKQMTNRQAGKTSYLLSMILLIVGLIIAIGLVFWKNELLWGTLLVIVTALPFIYFQLNRRIFNKWMLQMNPTETFLTDEDITKREEIISEQDKVQQLLDKVERDLKANQVEKLKLEERASSIQSRYQQLQEKITDQIEAYPFLENIVLTYWPKLYQQLMLLQERIIERYKEQEKNSSCRDQLKQLESKQAEALNPLNIDATEIEEKLTAEEMKRKEYLQLRNHYQQLVDEQNHCIDRQQPYLEEISLLFQAANTKDEHEFIEKGERTHEKREIEKKASQLFDSLTVWMDVTEINKIKAGEYDDEVLLKKQLTKISKEIDDVKEKWKQKSQQLSDQRAALEMLEDREEVSLLKHQIALKKEKLEKLAGEWAIDQIALERLLQAKNRYYEIYVPKVFQHASNYFSRLTLGRYQQLVLLEESNWIQVEDREGFFYTVDELSQGTKDQLYIAIRLALSNVMAKDLSLPFLIDDGFVHFDQYRKESILEILQELSEDHQILYFTTEVSSGSMIKIN